MRGARRGAFGDFGGVRFGGSEVLGVKGWVVGLGGNAKQGRQHERRELEEEKETSACASVVLVVLLLLAALLSLSSSFCGATPQVWMVGVYSSNVGMWVTSNKQQEKGRYMMQSD